MLAPETLKKLPKTVHSPKDWSYHEMKVRMISDQLVGFHRFILLHSQIDYMLHDQLTSILYMTSVSLDDS